MSLKDSTIQVVQSPAFVVSETLLRKNLSILKYVREQTGAKILLAQKAFSMYHYYPLIAEYLDGTTASGIYEAKLGYEEMAKKASPAHKIETHVYSPAYREEELDELLMIADHVVFNSFNQWDHFKSKALAAGKTYGLRINPEYSTQSDHAIYDPCSPGSRLGMTADEFEGQDLSGIDGLHFHTLCQQGVEDLVETLAVVEAKFGPYLQQMKWLNLGGGHHITRNDYNVDLLIETIKHLQDTYDLQVYLEPGEAIALDAGFLVASVLDTVANAGIVNAILDTSATCHMPDVLEMPYRPYIIGSDREGIKKFTYRLGGPTCLAGDIIGDYSFNDALEIGDRLVFTDMAIYSMVKTNTFNGMPLANIYALDSEEKLTLVKSFGYEDFKMRL